MKKISNEKKSMSRNIYFGIIQSRTSDMLSFMQNRVLNNSTKNNDE